EHITYGVGFGVLGIEAVIEIPNERELGDDEADVARARAFAGSDAEFVAWLEQKMMSLERPSLSFLCGTVRPYYWEADGDEKRTGLTWGGNVQERTNQFGFTADIGAQLSAQLTIGEAGLNAANACVHCGARMRLREGKIVNEEWRIVPRLTMSSTLPRLVSRKEEPWHYRKYSMRDLSVIMVKPRHFR
ncbi:uncharacterized protein LAESUDRAFT_718616, partial [Laetiporus sulphureus 93-53]